MFRLDEHLDRLEHSLQIVGIEPAIPPAKLGNNARELAQQNYAFLDPNDDLGLALFITPGINAGLSGSAAHLSKNQRTAHTKPHRLAAL